MNKNFYAIFFTLILLIPFANAQNQANLQSSNLKAEMKEQIMNPNYQDVRIKYFPFAVQCWTFRKFSFFETLKKVQDLGIEYLQAYPGQKLSDDTPDITFDHTLSEENIKLVKDKLKQHDMTLVAYGVVGFDNDEKSMGQVFDFAKNLGIRTIVTEPQYDDYSLIEKMVKEYDIQIAIHNHPTPSKYARPETVLEHIKSLDRRIGSCADTGHWLRTGVIPIEALRMLKGRVLDLHLKDLNEFGVKEAYDVPFGQGKAGIHDILAELTLQNYHGFLTIEHENEKEIDNPSPSIRKGIEYIKSITYYDKDYKELLKYYEGRYSKHGWNHYGPGYFILDGEKGVLKSQGGMGLFWFSEKKFRDFTLDLDFKCSEKTTNSGVFLRVPEMPTNDDYIFHSFEIQIADAGEGIHKTGAVYDAEAPEKDASKPTGEWNHFRITFKGNHIKVKLNDQIIIDWEAEPRGKVTDFASEGYIGLQNHDHNTNAPVYFRNIYIKEL